MMALILNLLLLGLLYACFWFILSLIFRRNDIADIAWGLGYIGLCIYFYFTASSQGLALLIYILVLLWGGRLSLHIGLRNRAKKEDFRYNNWRKEWGSSFYWRSFRQVYLLQVVLLLVISIPIIIVSGVTYFQWNFWTVAGLILWLVGFYWQAVGDWQLSQFKKHRKDKEEIIQTGLWKYSRHPNYFGEICMWTGIAVIVIPVENGLWGIVSPLVITYLLIYVSGVPMLEKRYKDNEAFKEYRKKTPTVFPFAKP